MLIFHIELWSITILSPSIILWVLIQTSGKVGASRDLDEQRVMRRMVNIKQLHVP
jgi:hypothetical protein